MKQRGANILIIVMCGGLLGGFAATLAMLDVVRFHPDLSLPISLWLLWSGLIAWGALLVWYIGNLIAGRLGFADPPLQKKLLTGFLIGLLILLLGGMLMPCVSRRSNRRFARECGATLGTQIDHWQTTLDGEKYPAGTMKEIYQQWLNHPPQRQYGAAWTRDAWRKHLEFYLTTHAYRHRHNVEQMPEEKDLVYVYCGQGLPRDDYAAILLYEKPGMHRLGGDIRNVIFAGGRYRAVPPGEWAEIDAQLNKTTAAKESKP